MSPSGQQADVVVEVSEWDNMQVVRDQIPLITLQFKDLLDPERLHESLVRLIDRDGWRRAGGRLRLNKAGKIELHIPKEFSPTRPAVGYGHRHYNVAIADHPIGSKMVSSVDPKQPKFHTPVPDLESLILRPGHPRGFKDYSTGDEPVLNLSVVTFKDATLVSFTAPHCAWDMAGCKEIVEAWRCVLDGREHDIKPVASFTRDPLLEVAELAEEQKEDYLQQKYFYSTWSWGAYVARILWEGLKGWNKPTPVAISIPPSYMSALREEALATQGSGGEAPVPFLSDGDILTAWTTRLCAGAVSNSPRTITLLNVLDVRGRLPTIFGTSETYLQNCIMALHASLSSTDLPTESNRLGAMAGAVRRAIIDLATPAQVALQGRAMRKAIAETGNMPLYGDSSSYSIITSNWTSAGHFKADFGAAAAADGNAAGRAKVVMPVKVHGTSINLPPVVTCWHILGKDAEGNYWVSGSVRGVTKEMMMAEIAKSRKA